MRAYCPDCGEKRARPGEMQVGHVIAQFIGASIQPSGRLWKSLGCLAWKPGQLASDACAGKRVAYMKPMQLFLICNILYFILQPFTSTNTLDNSLDSHLNRQIYSGWAREFSQGDIPTDREQFHSLSERFAVYSNRFSRSLVVLLIPGFTLLFLITQLPRRRSLAEHWLLATEFASFVLLFALIIVLGTTMRVGLYLHDGHNWPTQGRVASLAALGAVLPWTVLATRRFYQIKLRAALWRAALAVVCMIIPIWLFRALIFVLALKASLDAT